MLRLLKPFAWAAGLAAAAQTAFGFALLGPVNEPYQIPTIGYNLAGDIGAPKNLGEEYRRNTPVLYYTCDANFLDFFGNSGMAAIDAAFAAFNSVPRASSLSGDLTEYPYEALRQNFQAQALFLTDLKTIAMSLIAENMGLAQPDRFNWTLHDRWLPTTTPCPFGEDYFIIKRNFDPAIGTSLTQLKPTSYINGVLESYQIIELCNAPLPPQAVCQPFPVDPTALTFTAVAAENFTVGDFYTGLTRDDVGGLRYLLTTTNMNTESAGPNTLAHITNATPTLLVTSNLAVFAAQALTNPAATLQTLYPGLLVASSSNFFVNVFTTNLTPYFTNFPWDPFGTPAHLAFATNITANVLTEFQHTFVNTLLVTPTPTGWIATAMPTIPNTSARAYVTVETTTVGVSNAPWAPVGSTLIPTTNVFSTTFLTNGIVGDVFILPTNACEVAILYSQLTNVVTATNTFVATNIFANTNIAGTPLSFSQNIITYFTNHAFVYYPIICQPTNVALYEGIDKITFIRRDYDSLLSRFFRPITNNYVLNAITNFMVVPQRINRVVTVPDFLITAADLTTTPASTVHAIFAAGRSINYNTNNEYLGLAGPGTIETPTTFTFNKIGPLYGNGLTLGLIPMAETNAWLSELGQTTLLIWGSFDATTNAPVVYPNDLSVSDVDNMVLVQLNPPNLPVGTVGTAYSVQVSAFSSTPNFRSPYNWGLAPGSPGLPPGLSIGIRSDATSTFIYGTPTQDGFFDFVIRVVDNQGHVVDRSYAIQILPQT